MAPVRPADGERAAQLPVPRHRHGDRGGAVLDQRAAAGAVGIALVIVADVRLGGREDLARGTFARADADSVPAFGDPVAGDRHRAVLRIAEVDARHVGADGQSGLVDEREQDLLKVERGVQRARGDDRAVLDGARGAARFGLQAREAGGGLVGGKIGERDVVGRDLAALEPGDDQHVTDLAAWRRAAHNRHEQAGLDAVVLRAAGHDRLAGAGVRHRERAARGRHVGSARGAGPETQVVVVGRCAVDDLGRAGPVLVDLEHAHDVGAQQRKQGRLERAADRLCGDRLSGLTGEAVERTVLVHPGFRCCTQSSLAFPKQGATSLIDRRLRGFRSVVGPTGSARAGVLGAEVFELLCVRTRRRRLSVAASSSARGAVVPPPSAPSAASLRRRIVRAGDRVLRRRLGRAGVRRGGFRGRDGRLRVAGGRGGRRPRRVPGAGQLGRRARDLFDGDLGAAAAGGERGERDDGYGKPRHEAHATSSQRGSAAIRGRTWGSRSGPSALAGRTSCRIAACRPPWQTGVRRVQGEHLPDDFEGLAGRRGPCRPSQARGQQYLAARGRGAQAVELALGHSRKA